MKMHIGSSVHRFNKTMLEVYTFVLLLGLIFGTDGTDTNNIPSKLKYSLCFSSSKHCIECFQEASVIIFHKPFDQKEYRVPFMDQLNRKRSQYAKSNNISNMRFTNWIKEFEAVVTSMASYGTPIIECIERNVYANSKYYKVFEFKSEVQLEQLKNGDVLIREQFDNFTSQLLTEPEMMEYNLNEFGCAYSYNIQKLKLSTILRCMTYKENRLNTTVLQYGKLCNDCDVLSERCIELDWYEGLCVFQTFNETHLRLIIEPEVEQSVVLSFRTLPKLMYRWAIYVLNVIVSLLIVYVLYATCVICRHNREYEMKRISHKKYSFKC